MLGWRSRRTVERVGEQEDGRVGLEEDSKEGWWRTVERGGGGQ